MYDSLDSLSNSARWIMLGFLSLLAGYILLTSLVSVRPIASCSSHTPKQTDFYDSPNAVTNGMSAAIDSLSRSMDAAGQTAQCAAETTAAKTAGSGQLLGSSVVASATVTAHGAQFGLELIGDGLYVATTATTHGIGRGISTTTGFMAHTALRGFGLIIYIPMHIIRYTANSSIVSTVIRPAKNSAVPEIGEGYAVPVTVHKTLPAATVAQTAAPIIQASAATVWPIHGAITTEFGVPEPPYQPIHTGLDISDGKRSGQTSVYAFKAGKVSDVIHSSAGLGNHVIVDHGNGLTSVYGHMYSTSVSVGQQVDTTTVLGLEGSTGVSTGTHLHFEIRQDGQPMNPKRYINGLP